MAVTAKTDLRRPSLLVVKINRRIALFENLLGILLVITVVSVVAMQIVFRFFLSQPLSWSGELAAYILVWATFLGMAIAQRERTHVAMRILPPMSGMTQRAVDWACWLATFGMFLLLGIGGLELGILHHIERSPAMGLPIWLIYAALPIGGGLGLWHTIQDLPSLIRGEEVQKG
jgi:TRAP-type C4-dicarboxylate transport system permease small subunit